MKEGGSAREARRRKKYSPDQKGSEGGFFLSAGSRSDSKRAI